MAFISGPRASGRRWAETGAPRKHRVPDLEGFGRRLFGGHCCLLRLHCSLRRVQESQTLRINRSIGSIWTCLSCLFRSRVLKRTSLVQFGIPGNTPCANLFLASCWVADRCAIYIYIYICVCVCGGGVYKCICMCLCICICIDTYIYTKSIQKYVRIIHMYM